MAEEDGAGKGEQGEGRGRRRGRAESGRPPSGDGVPPQRGRPGEGHELAEGREVTAEEVPRAEEHDGPDEGPDGDGQAQAIAP